MGNPTLLSMPLCVNADKNTIPSTDAGTSGLFSEEKGFQTINSLPLTAGGKAPARQDFNGVFALLGGIDFMTQRGYLFEFDENLDYVASCKVRDTDGGIYFCKNDVSASSTHPKDDATNWVLINYGINKKETFNTSGSFTAPYTGVYKITIRGGGGGGAGGQTQTYGNRGGGGGGAGGLLTFYEKLTAGTSYSYTIGAGGTAGAVNAAGGGNGGDTSITINGNTYMATGGTGGTGVTWLYIGGYGGKGTINGTEVSRAAGGLPGAAIIDSVHSFGGMGGDNYYTTLTGNGTTFFGAGGSGGGYSSSGAAIGWSGGDGYITFEYCDI